MEICSFQYFNKEGFEYFWLPLSCRFLFLFKVSCYWRFVVIPMMEVFQDEGLSEGFCFVEYYRVNLILKVFEKKPIILFKVII